jgi:hypothetical protein
MVLEFFFAGLGSLVFRMMLGFLLATDSKESSLLLRFLGF